MKKALITGATGQDGAYLAKFLLEKGYKVYGGVRRTSVNNLERLGYLGITKFVQLILLEMLEQSNVATVIREHQFDEVYNLAAQSHVAVSFEQPVYTTQVDAISVCVLLDAIKTFSPHTRFYQASTSEMFGKVLQSPQSENTPFHPRSPYGVAKLCAHWMTVNYRERGDGLFACSGILFNHESPLRGEEFVTRKITKALAELCSVRTEPLLLGNLDAMRDWGFAGDYVEGMWAMLNAPNPDDYVLATGQTWSVREFVTTAAKNAGFDLMWEGEDEHEIGIDKKTGRTIVKVDPQFYRPAEVDVLTGDARKARRDLGWRPHTSLDELIEMMVNADLHRTK
jgi:GDPmannose 4,6-dehydratase